MIEGMQSSEDAYVELAVEVFAMLADPTRVRIVLALGDGELSVNTIADLIGKSPTGVSQHLAKLRMGRMVTTRQEGTRVFYKLAHDHVSQLVRDAIHQAEHAIDEIPRHHRTPSETAPAGRSTEGAR
ncbi:DNA-binding transcriptional ArsR family regulator [Friedmanniella endophytica]|uniref:DNA-binding transcriptional ArsR family regulator n=1 Tax=Microlunatus kandeliicorticis TaxID=1759536 RepID=A0A7W3P7H2_9ACTN|nr:metalloregulator ArsR/SmtB family transcription factor [Microlunatus kandeliicorticis]MBA8796126.1 DNA-binding transcriptional ArsR family regulator [Microlunatus kandeliicorticis]